MSLSEKGAGEVQQNANSKASANNKAGALILPGEKDTSVLSMSIEEMTAMAKKLRRHIIEMTGRAGSGHPGGSLSSARGTLLPCFTPFSRNADTSRSTSCRP
jgi:hypothetical protein